MATATLYQVRLEIKNLEDNQVFFDNFEGGAPEVDLDLNDEEIFPLLKEALSNNEVGSLIELQLKAEEAYGNHLPELVREVELELLPEELRQPGEYADFTLDSGDVLTGRVIAIEDGNAVIDFNSPLASKPVGIRCEIVNIKED